MQLVECPTFEAVQTYTAVSKVMCGFYCISDNRCAGFQYLHDSQCQLLSDMALNITTLTIFKIKY